MYHNKLLWEECVLICRVCPTQSVGEAQPAITCSKLTIETPERGDNFEHIQHLALMFLLLILSR